MDPRSRRSKPLGSRKSSDDAKTFGQDEPPLRVAEELDRTFDRIAANPLAWTTTHTQLLDHPPITPKHCSKLTHEHRLCISHSRERRAAHVINIEGPAG